MEDNNQLKLIKPTLLPKILGVAQNVGAISRTAYILTLDSALSSLFCFLGAWRGTPSPVSQEAPPEPSVWSSGAAEHSYW